MSPEALRGTWLLAVGLAVAVRLWNALSGPLMQGYDAPGHLAYVFFLDRYGALPWAHQGWGYFHPPLHYTIGWGLAQFGSADVLLRGLALVGSAASLGIAALAAWVTRAASRERPWLPLLAFVAVAFLPVHLYTSPMEGNELTCAFLGATALALLVRNECRAEPSIAGDGLTGAFIGLALLAKFSGGVLLATGLAAIVLRTLRDGAFGPAIRRAAVLAGVALVIAGPFYARGVAEYGTPFRMNRDYPLTGLVEDAQEPGSRSWRDFVSVSPKLLVDPSPGAPHLVHSIWGTAYVNTWVDTRALWNRLPEDRAERLRRARVLLLLAGLVPAALALAGAALALRDVAQGRRSGVYVPLLLCAVFALAAFGVFAVRVPRISALKASYLLSLSIPFGVFVARSVEGLLTRSRALAVLAAGAVALLAGVSAASHWGGLVHPPRKDGAGLGAVRHLLGDQAAARSFYEGRLASAPDSLRWMEPLAAVELADGNPARARVLYERASEKKRNDPHRFSRQGVAAALDGDLQEADELFDRAAARGAGASARANRGAVLAARGALDSAEAELRLAVQLDPELAVGWHNLAEVLERSGKAPEAARAREQWHRASHEPPRGYPYGVGIGLLLPGMRPLLWLEGDSLSLARAPFRESPLR